MRFSKEESAYASIEHNATYNCYCECQNGWWVDLGDCELEFGSKASCGCPTDSCFREGEQSMSFCG